MLPEIKVRVTADTDQAEAGLKRVEAGLKSTDAAAKRAGSGLTTGAKQLRAYGQAAQVGSHHTANLTAQFNDIGMMLAAGQSPLMLAMQQGTQVSQVFTQMGGTGKQALQGIMAGFMGMVSPLSLATLGIIAGGAALGQWAIKAIAAGTETRTLDEVLDDLKTTLDEYSSSADMAAMSTEDLQAKFGAAASTMQSTLELLEQIARSEAQDAIDGLAGSLSDLLGIAGSGDVRAGVAAFFDQNIFLAFTDAGREARDVAREMTGEFVNAQTALENSRGNLEGQIAATERLLAITIQLSDADGQRSDEERELIKQMAEGLELMIKQRGAVDQTTASIAKAAAVSYDMTEAIGETYRTMVEAEAITKLLEDGLSGAAIEALMLAGIDITSPIDSAARAAAELAAQYGLAYERALQLVTLGGPQGGRGGDPRQFDNRPGFRKQLEDQDKWTLPVPRGGGGRSGGGGAVATRDPAIEALINSLKTEDEILTEWREEGLATLAEANAKELEVLGGHAEAKLRLEEEYQRRLSDMRGGYHGDGLSQAQTFFGEMAMAMQGGSEKMLRIAKVFGAAESLVNSYRAYTAVLADPSLPWFARVPAALSVLSAGMGMVSAIKGVSAGGGASAGTSAAAGAAAAPAAPVERRVAEFRFVGGNVLDPRAIVDAMNDAYDQGYQIKGVLA